MSNKNKTCPVPGKFFVPGKILPFGVVRLTNEEQKGTVAEKQFQLLSNKNILAPLVQAFRVNGKDKNGVEQEFIKLGVVGFFDTRLGINATSNSFHYRYDLCINLDGTYGINVYIFYLEPRQVSPFPDCKPLKNQGLINIHFIFEDIFNKDVVFGSKDQINKGHTKQLSDVKTVKVFIISQNPEASRGTETTVQDDDE